MGRNLILLLIIQFGVVTSLPGGDIRLSEFMASNGNTLLDSDLEPSDWIEVVNQGLGAVNLEGWHLTDDPADLTKWAFPRIQLSGNDRIVVFASGKDQMDLVAEDGFPIKDSREFKYRLEFNSDGVLPSEEGHEQGWNEGGFWVIDGENPPHLSISDGMLTYNTVDFPNGTHTIEQTEGSAWANEITPDISFTFEVRLKVLAVGGLGPAISFWFANGGGNSTGALVRVGPNKIRFGYIPREVIYTGDNTQEFITIRIAYDGKSQSYSIWRNNLKILENKPGTVEDQRTALILLDFGKDNHGAGQLDYVRWESGRVFAPPGVPERGLAPHTNFKLGAKGEYLALVSPDGKTIVDEFDSYPEQVQDVSYGRDGYFAEPTPGSQNSVVYEGKVERFSVSHERGFYKEPFKLTLNTSTPGTTIRYTLDGTVPTRDHGFIYAGPVAINSTSTVRAIAFREGLLSSQVITHTYIFPADVPFQTGEELPENPKWSYQMNADIVNDPRFSNDMVEDLLAIPSLSLVLPPKDMFGADGIHNHPVERGIEWERATSVELLLPSGQAGFQLNGGIRIHGGGSRHFPRGKKSFRITFRKEYGAGKLNYPFFGSEGAKSHNILILRSNHYDSWSITDPGDGESRGWLSSLLLRDSFAYLSQWAMGHHSIRGRWVHLYIDRIYWGLYNVTERPHEDFAQEYFGGSAEDYDIYKNGVFKEEHVSGSMESWRELMRLIWSGTTDSEVYEQIKELLDVENFIDYIILNLYGGNTDWPDNNWYAFRDRKNKGQMKFISWDAEHVLFYLENDSNLDMSDRRSPGIIYDRLKLNSEFRVLFGDRVHHHFFNAGALSPERNAERFQKIVDEIRGPMDAESARWGGLRIDPPLHTLDPWLITVNKKLEQYFPQRTGIVLEQFKSIDLYPDFDPPTIFPADRNIEVGQALSFFAEEGIIYFSLDGSDPRLEGGGVSPTALESKVNHRVVLPVGSPAKAWVPTDSRLGLDWIQLNFDDSEWKSGVTGIGYERSRGFENFIGLDVEEEAFNINESVYIRIPFEYVGDLNSVLSMKLRMQYNDGFVAYLNGTRVVAVNHPEDLTWNSRATKTNAELFAREFESFDLSDWKSELVKGSNILAIHGLNFRVHSNDFLQNPELIVSEAQNQDTQLSHSTIVSTRSFSNNEWSALNRRVFVVDSSNLRITEIMYHPRDPVPGSSFDDDDFEFIEFQNIGETAINLQGITFSEGIEFTFPLTGIQLLEPGEIGVLVQNKEAFLERYPQPEIRILGDYKGRLDNDGETITLIDSIGETIVEFTYSDQWYPETDKEGNSLEIINPDGDLSSWTFAPSWKPSQTVIGSPGVVPASTGGLQLPGDANQNASLELSDAIAILVYLFIGGEVLPCEGSFDGQGFNRLLDLNADRSVDSSDTIYLLSYLFLGTQPPTQGTSCIKIEGCEDLCESQS